MWHTMVFESEPSREDLAHKDGYRGENVHISYIVIVFPLQFIYLSSYGVEIRWALWYVPHLLTYIKQNNIFVILLQGHHFKPFTHICVVFFSGKFRLFLFKTYILLYFITFYGVSNGH
jgi:hypothetical protein